MVDLYCERLGPGLWAEPLNAITNVAFLLAAVGIWRTGRGRDRSGTDLWLLVTLSGLIGIGSGLFHTFATPWSRALDVIPILLFELAFLWLYAVRVLRMRPGRVGGLLVAFLGAVLYGRQFPEVLDGSVTYIPDAFVLVILGFIHYSRHLAESAILLLAAGVFVASLFFRSIDAAICPVFPVGTHFLWHILNAILLYLLSRAYFRNLSVRTDDVP